MAERTSRKRIALVAHDSKKAEIVDWASDEIARLAHHELWGTGTTGARVADATGLQVNLLKSGPSGGPSSTTKGFAATERSGGPVGLVAATLRRC